MTIRLYDIYKAQSQFLRGELFDGGPCTGIALAALLEEHSLKTCLEYLKKETGRIPGNIYPHEFLPAYAALGMSLDQLKPSTEIDRSVRGVSSFAKRYNEGRYLVFNKSGSHVLAVIDGHIVDWSKRITLGPVFKVSLGGEPRVSVHVDEARYGRYNWGRSMRMMLATSTMLSSDVRVTLKGMDKGII